MFQKIRQWFQSPKMETVLGTDEVPQLHELERKLGYHFKNPGLLVQALKHRSYLGTTGEARYAANERMEFLGDAVLDLIVSDYLYKREEHASEGRLTQIKCSVVSGKMLAKLSADIGIGEYLLLSEGESRAGGRKRVSILEDAFEAVIGAMYLDGGLPAAEQFLHDVVLKRFDRFESMEPIGNHKSDLLEWSQDAGLGSPRYIVLSEEGPEHNKLFVVAAEIGGQTLASGEGYSKKQAEQNAAKVALEWLQHNPLPSQPTLASDEKEVEE